MVASTINTHDAEMTFGKYKGERVTRVPVSYLKWAIAGQIPQMIHTQDGRFQFWRIALAERGERLESIDLSAHAIDKLSLRHLDKWRERDDREEGLVSWGQRLALEAWEKRTEFERQKGGEYKIPHGGIWWIIEEMAIPVVKTVT